MNTLSLHIQDSNLLPYSVTNIAVDGMPLTELLYMHESARANAIHIPELAGCYEGLPPVIVLETTRHFMGSTISKYVYEGNRIGLLDYAYSGIPGDYTIACNIEVHKEVVIWNRFRNFSHLFQTERWRYGLVFCFDKRQYIASIEEAAQRTCSQALA